MDSGGVGFQQSHYSQFGGAYSRCDQGHAAPRAAWNLVRAVRSIFPSKQAVTALSVRQLHAVHVLYIQYSWAGLGQHSSDLFLSGDALP